MAGLIVSGNANQTSLPSAADDQLTQGQRTIEVNAAMPEFDISTGDFMRLDFDCKRVTADGLYVVAEGG